MLNEICRHLQVDSEYYDIWGQPHRASEPALRAILGSLGLAADNDEALGRSWAALVSEQESSILEPVTVAVSSLPVRVLVRRRPAEREQDVTATLTLEQGDTLSYTWPAASLEPADENADELLSLPAGLPLGYHSFEIELRNAAGDVRRGRQRLIVAPERAYLPERLTTGGRLAGIAISLYGIRSARNWGAGDFTDLEQFVRWAARDLGVSIVALNPLHAIHNREPYNTSPYLPLASFYRNYLYLDIDRIPEMRHSRAARTLLARAEVQAAIASSRAADLVDYEGVARLKRSFLRLLFREFLRREWRPRTERARAFERYIAAEGDLLDRFATYCTLDEVLHRRDRNLWIWPDWPAPFRDPSSEAAREVARLHWRRILYHKWVQWQIDEQLRQVQAAAKAAGMEVGLYHDLALATDSCGADLWAHRGFFAQGCRVGSPPDDFAPEGQDWAFPPPLPEAHRRTGYELFAETIRKNSRHGGALRIDHFMRFFRLFWIPDGLPAREGTYVREPFEDLMRVLALESVRGRFMVIGEDLGTCPPEVREGMARYGVLSYKLFYFEKGPDGLQRPPGGFPHLALVSSTTHDLPTLAGFWQGRDIEVRMAAGLSSGEDWRQRQLEERRAEKRRMVETLKRDGFLPADFPPEASDWPELTGELHNAVIGWLCSTPSAVMLLNQEDLTKETEQQNLPGTTTQHPNWKRKMKLSLEDLRSQQAAGFVAMFRAWLERTGRARAAPPSQIPGA
jgi:4-alpha-glucanotransferase